MSSLAFLPGPRGPIVKQTRKRLLYIRTRIGAEPKLLACLDLDQDIDPDPYTGRYFTPNENTFRDLNNYFF
jgi:hypothetical protein